MSDHAQPGLRLNVGVSGSGKSYTMWQHVCAAVRAGVPTVVLDRLREHTSIPADLMDVAAGVAPGPRAVSVAARLVADGARLVIVQTADVASDFSAACEWAVTHEAHVGVCVSEAHRVAPNTGAPLPTHIEDVALAWRHHRVSLWTDTQRLSLLHRTLTEQVRELRVFAVGGQLDRAKLRDYGGRELEEAAMECARRLTAGEPGWHTTIRTVALPPYELERT